MNPTPVAVLGASTLLIFAFEIASFETLIFLTLRTFSWADLLKVSLKLVYSSSARLLASSFSRSSNFFFFPFI